MCSSIIDLYRHTICMQMTPHSALNGAINGLLRAVCHSVYLTRLSHSKTCPALSRPRASFADKCLYVRCSSDHGEWSLSGNCEKLGHTFIPIHTHTLPQLYIHIIRAQKRKSKPCGTTNLLQMCSRCEWKSEASKYFSTCVCN